MGGAAKRETETPSGKRDQDADMLEKRLLERDMATP